MGIAIAIVAVVALAVIGLVVTARSRATTGRLSRETRKRDEAAGASTAAAAAAPADETDRARPRRPRVATRADEARKAIESGSAQVPEPRAAGTAVVYEPVDLDELGVTRRQFFNRSILAGSGLGLGAFGVAALAFLWPSAGGGFGGKIVVGSEADAKDAFDNKIPFYNAAAKTYIVAYPKDDLPKAKKVPAYTAADHRRDGDRATSRSTRSACTWAAACRGARARSGSSAPATARSTTGSARSRVVRRRAVSTASRSRCRAATSSSTPASWSPARPSARTPPDRAPRERPVSDGRRHGVGARSHELPHHPDPVQRGADPRLRRLRHLPRGEPAAEPGAEAARQPHAVLRRRRARRRAPRARARCLADRAGRRGARRCSPTSSGSRSARPTPTTGSRTARSSAAPCCSPTRQSKEYDSTKSLLCATCHGTDGGGGTATFVVKSEDPRCDPNQVVNAKLAEEQPYCLPAAGGLGRAQPAGGVAEVRPQAAHADHHLRQTGHPDAGVGCAQRQGRAAGAEHPGPRELRREPRHHPRQGAGGGRHGGRELRPTTRSTAPRASGASSSSSRRRSAAADKWVVDAQAELDAAQALARRSDRRRRRRRPTPSSCRRSRRRSQVAPGLAADHAVGHRRRAPVHEQLRPLPHAGLVVLRRHQPAGRKPTPPRRDHGRRRVRPQPHRWRREQPVPAAERRVGAVQLDQHRRARPTSSTASAASRRAACRTSVPSSPRRRSKRSWPTSDRCRSRTTCR